MEQASQQQPQKEPQEEAPPQKTRRGRLWTWMGFGEKRGWDWMQLLIVPVVLAIGGFLFSWTQENRQQDYPDINDL